MTKYLSLHNISITKKLSLGFGLLILLSVVLSLVSLHAQNDNEKSLARISRLGSIFDQTVAIRENNFAWMLEHTDNSLALHDKSMSTINQNLDTLLNDIAAGNWPAEDKEMFLQMVAALNDYQTQHKRVRAQNADQHTINELNDQMQVLQEKINGIYLKVEERTASRQEINHLRLIIITLISIAIGLAAAYVISVQITRPLKQILRVTQQIAEGDLTAEISSERRDELGLLILNMMTMKKNLHGMVDNIRLSSEHILNVTDGIIGGNTDLSARTEQQAAAIEETAASMEQLTATVNQNTENAHYASKQATKASDKARQGGDIVASVVQTMNSISGSSQKISEITDVIDGIAFQTNILALNASVEAARAGEQGRGFAVVAGEVRNLAQRSAEAAKQIETLIAESSALVNSGSVQVNDAGQTMAEVVRAITDVTTVMEEIATASDEQNRGISQVGQAIIELDTATQKNASLVQSASVEVAALKEQSGLLNQAIADFTLSKAQVSSARHRQKTSERSPEWSGCAL